MTEVRRLLLAVPQIAAVAIVGINALEETAWCGWGLFFFLIFFVFEKGEGADGSDGLLFWMILGLIIFLKKEVSISERAFLRELGLVLL